MLQQTRYFTPLYEVVDEDDSQKLIHYFSSPTGIFAIFTIENGNNGRMKYVLKDHQGSLAALVNEKSGTEYFSFDAWGRRRNAQTWIYTNMPISFGTTRGFTMHEHLDEFKLINMNGRVYDPLVGRFISPDPFLQMPAYSQSYNRYSYAFNNPLRFSDPSGFFAEGDSTLSPSRALLHLPFLPAQRLSYRPGASTNTDNTSLGIMFKETETALPAPYHNSKPSRDAEGNASEVASNGGDNWHLPMALREVGSAASYASGAIGLTQTGMLEYRMSLPIMSKIGTFGTFSSTYRGLGVASKTLGRTATYIGAPLSIGLDYSAYRSGDISLGLFGYRTGSLGVSIGTGAAIGGPWGAAAGAAVGGISVGAEYIYDNFLVPLGNEIQYQIWNFENAIRNGWYPGR